MKAGRTIRWTTSLVAALALLGGIFEVPGAGAAARATAPAGLTPGGNLLWNLESLLKSHYGSKPVFVTLSNKDDAFCGGQACGPLATSDPYFYTFSSLGRSDLSLVKRKVAGLNFGNYPVPVLVEGLAVACDGASHNVFLVRFSDAASFSLACAAPRPSL